jgi:PRTRC genetic system protein A
MTNQANNHLDDFLAAMENEPDTVQEEETTANLAPVQEEPFADEPKTEQPEDENESNTENPKTDESDEDDETVDDTDESSESDENDAENESSECDNSDETSEPSEAVQRSLPENEEDDDDEFEKALKKCRTASDGRVIANLATKTPIFKHANFSDPIADTNLTFEDLRKKYEADIPELEAKENVSWTVFYGKCTQAVSKPDNEKIADVKAKIEKSKAFIDSLKNAKKNIDKNPECLVKPFVKSGKKGDTAAMALPMPMPSYKGFYFDADEAVKSSKQINYVPSRDGTIYEIRKNTIGIFQSPAKAIGEFPQLQPKFIPKLPKIPMFLLYRIISFFRTVSTNYQLEALVHLMYDTKTKSYSVKIPKQKLTKHSVDAVFEQYPDDIIHVMDLHSHNTMAAKFSKTDDNDEKATRLYGVIGRLDKEIPDMSIRASNGGKFINLKFGDVFDVDATYPESWDDELNHSFAEAVCTAEITATCDSKKKNVVEEAA